MELDLNADVGEGAGTDAEVIPLVTSVNVCGGLYAGGPDTIRAAVELAAKHGAAVGVHPGYADREHFGRRDRVLSAQQLSSLLGYQIGAVQAVARFAGPPVRYVKPHGALYNLACRDESVARVVMGVALLHGLSVVGLPGSALEAVCRNRVRFVPEGYADRRYRPDGSLLPRTEPDAIIHDPREAVEQVQRLARERGIRTACIHGDHPEAVRFARALRESLTERGFNLKTFA